MGEHMTSPRRTCPASSRQRVTGLHAAAIIGVRAVVFDARMANIVACSGSIGSLIVLVIYLLTTLAVIVVTFSAEGAR
jgi:hypothetical protein